MVGTRKAPNRRVWAMEDCDFRNLTASARGSNEEPGKNVRQKAGLNRSFQDIAPGTLRSQVDYKAAWEGGALLKVPAAYTSQRCSSCGRHPKDHPDTAALDHGRVSRDLFRCPFCGFTCDADLNAARNIRSDGLSLQRSDRRLRSSISADGESAAACGAICDTQPEHRLADATPATVLPSEARKPEHPENEGETLALATATAEHGREAGRKNDGPKRGRLHAD